MLRLLFIFAIVLSASAPAIAGRTEKPSVAVLYFDNNSGDESLDVLSKGFADMLITDLSGTGSVTVVEREKLQALLDESKLQRSKFFDPKTAVRIGKGLGARYVLSGSFLQVKPLLRIDIRMIDVKTSKVVLATQVKGANSDIFRLEQQLVSEFLGKLNHTFFSAKLPPTKVPDLEALLSYSKGLALIDKGEDAKAAAMMKKLVSKAPAFGLARSKHTSLIRKLAESSANREQTISREKDALFAEAKSYIASHSVAKMSKDEAQHYLAYRSLLGLQLSAALHANLKGRNNSRTRVFPRKGAGRAFALMRAFYENQRHHVEENSKLAARHGRLHTSLPDPARDLASGLDLDPRTSFPVEDLVDFLLHGSAPSVGDIERYRFMPAPADVDPKLKKAALALAKAQLALTSSPGQPLLDGEQSRIMRSLADWHIERGRVEQGIGELQKILDRFPKLHNWSYIEGKIKQQLGLEGDHSVRSRTKFETGLSTCDQWPYNAGMSVVLTDRFRSLGMKALPSMEKELQKRCGKSPKLSRMQKILYRNAFLKAGHFEDCEWFELYLKKWLALGGSTTDAAGYRKNYSDCR